MAAVEVGVPKPGFVDGMKALFGGFGFVMTNPSVWPLAIVPIAIALVLSGLLGGLALDLVPPLIAEWLGPSDSAAWGVLTWVVQAAVTAAAVIGAFLVSFGVAQTLAGPALEAIVRRRERALGLPERPNTPFWLDIARSFKSGILPVIVAGPILLVLFVVQLAFAPAVVVTFPLKVLVTTVAMAWDVCDYPLSVRGAPIGARMDLIRQNLKPLLGFSLGLVVIALIPCALLLALPAGVAGATALVHRIEAARGSG